ncbi:MAG: aroE [Chloroflexi bacterium]|jgi:3-dehydroquinate dehydratase/shikimate dehydrogenase|nr:aroE [Chloroflexota bacterium]
MPGDATLRTERLLLRPWSAGDRAAFAELNADPHVMEWFPSTLSRAESDALAERIEQQMDVHGWGLWAVEVPGIADFIGFVGLSPADGTLGYPSVEVGWRLAPSQWGRGYAPEGALAALRFGFQTLELEEIVSFTSAGNVRSRRVMEKLGMVRRPEEDFDHPRIPLISPLCRHVLYRITHSTFWTQGPTHRGGSHSPR